MDTEAVTAATSTPGSAIRIASAEVQLANLRNLVDLNTANLANVANLIAALRQYIQDSEIRLANMINAAEWGVRGSVATLQKEMGTRFAALDTPHEAQAYTTRGILRALRGKVGQPADGSKVATLPRPSAGTLQSQLFRLRESAPAKFGAWVECFEAARRTYRTAEAETLSTGFTAAGESLRLFVNAYAEGRLLDVGCGPQALPSYLEDYPLNWVAGIDPIMPAVQHPFQYANAVAEEPVFKSESFDTAICAWSIDRMMDPELAIERIHDVLTPGARLIVASAVGLAPEFNSDGSAYRTSYLTNEGLSELLAKKFTEVCTVALNPNNTLKLCRRT